MSDNASVNKPDVQRAVLAGAASGAVSGAPAGVEGMVVSAGLGALGGGAAHLVTLAAEHLRSPADRRLFAEQERLAANAIDEIQEPLRKKLEALEERVGAHEAAASVVPTLRRWSGAWFGSEGKKQRVIMAALVSAFDPESHETAMSHRFFRLLEELDYPEIYHLCSDVRALRARVSGGEISMSASFTDEASRPGDERSTHRVRLDQLGLVRLGRDPRTWSFTWLGLELVKFLERGGYPHDGAAPGHSTTE